MSAVRASWLGWKALIFLVGSWSRAMTSRLQTFLRGRANRPAMPVFPPSRNARRCNSAHAVSLALVFADDLAEAAIGED